MVGGGRGEGAKLGTCLAFHTLPQVLGQALFSVRAGIGIQPNVKSVLSKTHCVSAFSINRLQIAKNHEFPRIVSASSCEKMFENYSLYRVNWRFACFVQVL